MSVVPLREPRDILAEEDDLVIAAITVAELRTVT